MQFVTAHNFYALSSQYADTVTKGNHSRNFQFSQFFSAQNHSQNQKPNVFGTAPKAWNERRKSYVRFVTIKDFPGLKKIKIHVFASVLLLYNLQYHKALVYLTMHFFTLVMPPPKNSGDENNHSFTQLLFHVLLSTHPQTTEASGLLFEHT